MSGLGVEGRDPAAMDGGSSYCILALLHIALVASAQEKRKNVGDGRYALRQS